MAYVTSYAGIHSEALRASWARFGAREPESQDFGPETFIGRHSLLRVRILVRRGGALLHRRKCGPRVNQRPQ